jgi:RimJ/RimL family protein N-acetyltransferase
VPRAATLWSRQAAQPMKQTNLPRPPDGREVDPMILRAATQADVDALLDVQQPAAVHGLGHIFSQDQHPFPRAAIAARWRTEIADPDVRVHLYADRNSSIQGFAAIRGHELLHFGTAQPTWSTGLASRFHAALLGAVAESLGTPTTLTLRVFEENRRARRFYDKHGWQPTGRSSRTTFPPHPLLLEYEHHLTVPSS